jgi:hypothetical protein
MTLHSSIDTVLSTVFSGEFNYIQRPDIENVETLPDVFGLWMVVGGISRHTLEGDIEATQPRVQVSIYAINTISLIAMVEAVKTAMEGANIAGTLLNYSASVPVDGFDDETRRFYSHMDYYINFNE